MANYKVKVCFTYEVDAGNESDARKRAAKLMADEITVGGTEGLMHEAEVEYIKTAEDAEREACSEANDALWREWHAHRQEMGKAELRSIESVEFGPDVRAINGLVVLMSDQSDFGGGRDWYSKPIENPTWGQVLLALHQSIKVTKDGHHVFMEGVSNTGKTLRGLPVYRIDTGS